MLRLAAIVLLGLTTLAPLHADEFPTRPIRIIVPYSPGGPSDAISRAFAVELGKTLGTTVIIENKPGAGTAIGTQSAKMSPADGYTLLFGANIFITTTLTMKTPGYKIEDFTPVAHLGDTFYVLAAPKVDRFNSLKTFIDHARNHPGKLNYATLGPGATSHLLSDRLQRLAKFSWTDIAYRGTAPALQAVMSDEVQGYFTSQGTAASLKDSDRIQLLAIASDERSPVAPWIPTFKELGYPEMTEPAWFALFARGDTPDAILNKIRSASRTAMSSSTIREQQQKLGLSPNTIDLGKFSQLIAEEYVQRTKELAQIGIKPE